MPVILDFYNCYPVNDVTVAAALSNSNVGLDTLLIVPTISSSTSVDSRVIFQAQNSASNNAISAGTTVTMTFSITGTNAASYIAPAAVTLNFIDPVAAGLNTAPVASAVQSTIKVVQNTATATFSCN
jgi:hypothetical protein